MVARVPLFSGIQPTGELHIGNYLGALRNWISLQDEYEAIYCVVDLHAITIDYDVAAMPTKIFDAAAWLLACGVDPDKATLFVQSQVPEHAQLTWVFNAVTPFGDLGRMTQFKEKSQQHQDNINVGLYDYPVLQAADILLYKGQAVPVGEDQVQHIELTRRIARKFNNRFGELFPEPKWLLLETGARIMGLDGQSKMSKSQGNYIALADSPELVWEKLKPAYTDPQRLRRKDPGRPEVCNIFSLHQALSPPEVVDWAAEGCRSAGIGCFDCKKRLAESLEATFGPIREKHDELVRNPEQVLDVLEQGRKRCTAIAQETMAQVWDLLGVPGPGSEWSSKMKDQK